MFEEIAGKHFDFWKWSPLKTQPGAADPSPVPRCWVVTTAAELQRFVNPWRKLPSRRHRFKQCDSFVSHVNIFSASKQKEVISGLRRSDVALVEACQSLCRPALNPRSRRTEGHWSHQRILTRLLCDIFCFLLLVFTLVTSLNVLTICLSEPNRPISNCLSIIHGMKRVNGRFFSSIHMNCFPKRAKYLSEKNVRNNVQTRFVLILVKPWPKAYPNVVSIWL